MICPECGTQLATGGRFCHKCGWDSRLAAAGRADSTAAERPAWKRWTTGVSLSVFALLLFWLLLIPRGTTEPTLIAGDTAPEFDLPTMGGDRIRLSDLKGRPVVVNFWATWCTPCRKEMPDFQAMADRYGGEGLVVLGINVGESRIGIADFVQSVGVTFPILVDERETAQTDYRILPLPATFFIDRDGTIRSIYQFQMSRLQMETEALRILGR